MSTIFDDIQKRLQTVKDIMSLTEEEYKILKTPDENGMHHEVLDVNGKKYPAWRICYNRALGPGKGGIRFHEKVNEDEVKSLAFWMSLKNSLAGLPYGGAKGGVQINSKEHTKGEIEDVSRAYARAFAPYIGQDKDIPAPDVYTNAQVMAWMLDEYEKTVGHHEPGMITGKPLCLGGSPLRGDATAEGGFLLMNPIVDTFFNGKQGLRIVVQGFGNAGALFAEKIAKDGKHKVVAVSDSQGGIYDTEGLSILEIQKIKEDKGTVTAYDAQKISNAEILELDCDILVLAALENQVTEENANNIKAKVILELANGPVTETGDEILFSKGIQVIPDILANSGGVIVSYFEWCQNKTGNILDNQYLKDLLSDKMQDAWRRVYTKYEALENKYDLRISAYVLAVERILEAEKLRGHVK